MKGEVIPYVSSRLVGEQGLLELTIDWARPEEQNQQGTAYGYGAQAGGVSLNAEDRSISYSVSL